MSKASKALFNLLNQPTLERHEIIPHIDRFLTIHPHAGVYEVDDGEHVSSVKDRRHMKWHPSGDCLKCERLLYYERDETAPPIIQTFEPRTQSIFKEGAAIHAMIQAWFKKMGELDGFPRFVGNEVRIDDDVFNISGYIDSVVDFSADGTAEVLIELKTINDYQFQQLRGPKPEHKLQVGAYMMATGISEAIVLYYNKNTSEMNEYLVEPVDMQNVLIRWQNVDNALDEGSPDSLARSCKKGSRQWERCPARHICYRE